MRMPGSDANSTVNSTKHKIMNPQVKAKWLDALRSGYYEQGKGKLRTETGFCCLGVLCDLYAEEHKDVHWKTSYVEGDYTFLGREGTLPEKVVDWADLKSSTPSVSYENDTYELAMLNDSVELSFDEIADVIEEQL